MGRSGYIYVFRSMCDTWIGRHRREEWVDLKMLAAFSDTTVMFSGYPVKVRRGQYATTYRVLKDKLGISSLSSVKLFLDRAQEDGLITLQPIHTPKRNRTQDRTPDGTLITIVNYDPNRHLRDSENGRRNVDSNSEQHIEEVSEVSDKKQAAAAVQCVCESPAENDTTAPRNSGASEVPPELDSVFDLLHKITQVSADWPPDQISRMIELAEEVGWPAIREHVERIATREVKRGKPPKSLRYYIRAIREDAGRSPNLRSERSGVLPAHASARGMSSPNQGRPQSHEPYRRGDETDPELGANYKNCIRQFGAASKE